MGLLSEERRREIVELVHSDGRALVRDLAKRYRTSLITIRKDLEHLHRRGLIERTHGGALSLRAGALIDRSLQEKEKLHREQKQRIAEAAACIVQEGQVVILDSGTTTTAVARALRRFQNLTIITNAVNIAALLAGSSIEVILTGGTLRKNSFSLVGPLAEDALRHVNADILFLGVDGIDRPSGLTTPNLQEARVNRVMIEAARRTVLVADSSKFGRRSLSLIAPTKALREIITDKGIPRGDLRALRKMGIEVTLV